jgi:uncharacterized membrane protein YhaH (DUF805 family)
VKLTRLLFWFRGRIARGRFWGGTLLLGLAFFVLFVFLKTELGERSTLVLYPFFFWIAAALMMKRLHDRGRSAWWLFIALIPILGALWLIAEIFFRRGTRGDNQYGADPVEIESGYLVVDISRP